MVVWGLIGLVLAAVVIVTIVDVVRRHLGAGRTAAWILLVLLLPFVGSLLYWGLRRPTKDEVDLALAAERDMHHTPPAPGAPR